MQIHIDSGRGPAAIQLSEQWSWPISAGVGRADLPDSNIYQDCILYYLHYSKLRLFEISKIRLISDL